MQRSRLNIAKGVADCFDLNNLLPDIRQLPGQAINSFDQRLGQFRTHVFTLTFVKRWRKTPKVCNGIGIPFAMHSLTKDRSVEM